MSRKKKNKPYPQQAKKKEEIKTVFIPFARDFEILVCLQSGRGYKRGTCYVALGTNNGLHVFRTEGTGETYECFFNFGGCSFLDFESEIGYVSDLEQETIFVTEDDFFKIQELMKSSGFVAKDGDEFLKTALMIARNY